jgi:cytochrome c heme-lyase
VQQTKPYTCTCTRAARPQVVEWEATLHPECLSGLKLLRFRGRPDEPTPKARALSLMGYSSPFDRHDWVVTRCGKEVTTSSTFTTAPALGQASQSRCT